MVLQLTMRALAFAALGVCLLEATPQGNTGMFISKGSTGSGLYCAEGAVRAAEAALALKKAAPYGAMFVDSFVRPGGQNAETCADHGFTYQAGVDSCTPDVATFFKSEADVAAFAAAQRLALNSYAEKYSLSESMTSLMSNCTCQPGSSSLAATDSCDALDDVTGCWVHESPYTLDQMMCDEGPYVYAMRVLSVLKSSPQLAMHFSDQIRATTCKDVGFPLMFSPPDHCYPAMRIWTRTDISTDAGIKESEDVESNLTHGGFETFAQSHGFGDMAVLSNNLGCNCFANSSVGQQMKGLCTVETNHSPVRDWWPGDPYPGTSASITTVV